MSVTLRLDDAGAQVLLAVLDAAIATPRQRKPTPCDWCGCDNGPVTVGITGVAKGMKLCGACRVEPSLPALRQQLLEEIERAKTPEFVIQLMPPGSLPDELLRIPAEIPPD